MIYDYFDQIDEEEEDFFEDEEDDYDSDENYPTAEEYNRIYKQRYDYY